MVIEQVKWSRAVRAMFKKDEHAKVRLDVNEVIEEVLDAFTQ